jgi:hypothetical protein
MQHGRPEWKDMVRKPTSSSVRACSERVSGAEERDCPIGEGFLRDRSTDRGSVSNVEEPVGAAASSDDGFGWAQVGVGAVSLLALMFLLMTVTLRRGRQQPKRA